MREKRQSSYNGQIGQGYSNANYRQQNPIQTVNHYRPQTHFNQQYFRQQTTPQITTSKI
jgi:hypothetical protein